MKVEDYKGHPILVLQGSKDEREVRLGITKCKAVLANTDTIKAFLAQYDAPKPEPAVQAPVPPTMAGVDFNALQAALAANPALGQAINVLTSQTKTPAVTHRNGNGRFSPK